MYKKVIAHRTNLERNEAQEGEMLEAKFERMMTNNEPLTDGAPLIYTERKDGVEGSYNIRTDRFEVALDGMDAITKSVQAKRENRAKMREAGVIELNGEAKDIQGTDGKI